MPFYLFKNEPIARGLRRIAHEQIMIGLRDSADDAKPVRRGVHSLRIRCKKLRGLLRLPQPLMGETFALEDQRIRQAAKHLAENRDRDVIARTIESFDEPDWQPDLEYKPVSRQDLEWSRGVLTSCLNTIEEWPLDIHGFYDIAPGFARTYRKTLGAWERVEALRCDDSFHRLRKWGKYHWYQIRILERLNKPVLRERRKRLRKLQLMLGDAHDLAVLQAYLNKENIAPEQLLERVRARKKDLYKQAFDTGQKIFMVPVSKLVADLCCYWADQRHNE
jgi:CHAD domain-containing protein